MKYSETMTAAELSRFVRAKFSELRADSILARMGNGASFEDAKWATRGLEAVACN
jgi:hypothetical protein